MNNNEIINNIIANTAAPAEVLEAFRIEAMESGYDLATLESAPMPLFAGSIPA